MTIEKIKWRVGKCLINPQEERRKGKRILFSNEKLADDSYIQEHGWISRC